MKAWILHDIGKISYEEREMPKPGKGEVLLKVHSAGICGSDIPRIYQTGAHNMPLIPGHEFSGEVVEAGQDADRTWLGKRVGVFPLIPCRDCFPCRQLKYEMCRHYDYLGSRSDGGFAEYVAVPEWNLIELPEGVSYDSAAMLEPMSVGIHAIRGVAPERGEKITVCGLGTIGTLLVMSLINIFEIDANDITAIGNKESQKNNVEGLGVPAGNFLDIRQLDTDKKETAISKFIAERTNGIGTNVFFECTGSNESYSWGVDILAPSGRLCLMGNPHSDMELKRDVYWKILRNQLKLMGTWNSSFTGSEADDWHMALNAMAKNGKELENFISHRYPLEKLDEGFEIMRDKNEEYIKIMGQI